MGTPKQLKPGDIVRSMYAPGYWEVESVYVRDEYWVEAKLLFTAKFVPPQKSYSSHHRACLCTLVTRDWLTLKAWTTEEDFKKKMTGISQLKAVLL